MNMSSFRGVQDGYVCMEGTAKGYNMTMNIWRGMQGDAG
jgi:hypothetical protein